MRWVSPFPAVFQEFGLIVGDDVAAQSVVDAVRRRHIGGADPALTLALRFRAIDRDFDRG